MEEKNFIDSLGRWFDDSRMADRNRRLPANDSREFCSNRVVNITTPTFILSAKFRSYCNRTIKYFGTVYSFSQRFSTVEGVNQIREKAPNSSLIFSFKR